MNNEQIIEYCRDLIEANLKQYIDTGNTKEIVREIYDLENDETNKYLLAHCKGVKSLLEKCISIIEEEQQ